MNHNKQGGFLRNLVSVILLAFMATSLSFSQNLSSGQSFFVYNTRASNAIGKVNLVASPTPNVPALSTLLTPPQGDTVFIKGGSYFWQSHPQTGISSLTPVPALVLIQAKNAQLTALANSIIASGYSNLAASVYFGDITGATLIPPSAGYIVTENGAGQVISYQFPLKYGNPGYVTVAPSAPASPNLPTVATTTNAAGQLVFTGVVIDYGATTVGNAPVIPVEPDTVVSTQTPVSVYVGAAIGWTPPVGVAPAYSTWDSVPDGTYVEWSNRASNGAPAGFYLKHQISNAGPFGTYVTRWYESVDPSKVPPAGVIQN